MPTWSLFTTSDILMSFMAFVGFMTLLIVLKIAYKANRNG